MTETWNFRWAAEVFHEFSKHGTLLRAFTVNALVYVLLRQKADYTILRTFSIPTQLPNNLAIECLHTRFYQLTQSV